MYLAFYSLIINSLACPTTPQQLLQCNTCGKWHSQANWAQRRGQKYNEKLIYPVFLNLDFYLRDVIVLSSKNFASYMSECLLFFSLNIGVDRFKINSNDRQVELSVRKFWGRSAWTEQGICWKWLKMLEGTVAYYFKKIMKLTYLPAFSAFVRNF